MIQKHTRKQLILLYEYLFGLYGPQKWWPAESPWEVAVGAILTQNTNWNNVEKAISNLKNAGFLGKGGNVGSSRVLKSWNSEVESSPSSEVPDHIKLMNSDFDTISQLIRPSGYYNIKTEKLFSIAEWWEKNVLDDSLNKGLSLKRLRKSLLSVNGVGPETADSIILYSFNLPSFVIDTYTKRICSVYLQTPIDIDYHQLQSTFMDNLPHDYSLFNEYHALLVRLAKEKEWRKVLDNISNC